MKQLSVTRCILVGVAVACFASGCNSMKRVDRNVQKVVNETADELPAVTSSALADAFKQVDSDYTEGDVLEVDRDKTLRLATLFSRDLQTQREQLYEAALSLMGVRRQFGLQYNGTLAYTFGVSGDNPVDEGNLELKADRILYTGSRLALTANSKAQEQANFLSSTNGVDGFRYNNSVGLRLTQPLLAGAGYERSHEELIQAERNLVYAIRSFALQRQDFALSILTSYYGLLNQQKVLENTRLNVERSTFLRKRSEALFKIQMAPAIDVLRSQQQELSAKNQLSDAETAYLVGLKRFLITLGLPVDVDLNLVGEFPAARPVTLNEDESIEAGLAVRLDLHTTRDRAEDADRGLRNSRNRLLPQLDAFVATAFTEENEEGFGEDLEDQTVAGVTLSMFVDKREERDALKRAELAVRASRRQLEQTEDTIQVEIIENFRRLRSLEFTVQIQEQNMDIAERRARNAFIRFKSGELSNRDVVEAENELLSARNAHAQALVDYELQRLRLLRNVGLLDVTEDGTLVELNLQSLQPTESENES